MKKTITYAVAIAITVGVVLVSSYITIKSLKEIDEEKIYLSDANKILKEAKKEIEINNKYESLKPTEEEGCTYVKAETIKGSLKYNKNLVYSYNEDKTYIKICIVKDNSENTKYEYSVRTTTKEDNKGVYDKKEEDGFIKEKKTETENTKDIKVDVVEKDFDKSIISKDIKKDIVTIEPVEEPIYDNPVPVPKDPTIKKE